MNSSYEIYKGFKVRLRNEQKILLLEKNRIEESRLFMLNENILGLELNYVFGISDTDYAFLKNFDFVNYISILDWWTKDISQIHHLKNIHTLHISTYCKTKIDFTAFPKLKSCVLYWRNGAKSLYECSSLVNLCLFHYNPKEKDLSNLLSLKNLKQLQINNSPISNLSGIETMQQLEKLELYYLRNLEDIENTKILPDL